MTAFYYTAVRDVMSGHTAGNAYNFDALLSAKQMKPKVHKVEHIPLGGGAGETVVNRREKIYTMSSLREDGNEAAQWLEFLSSVDGGEQFQVDLSGTVASPGTLQNAVLVKDYSESFFSGSNDTKYTFSFRLI